MFRIEDSFFRDFIPCMRDFSRDKVSGNMGNSTEVPKLGGNKHRAGMVWIIRQMSLA